MNWKKIGKHLLFPSPVVAGLVVALAAAGLIYAFAGLEEGDLHRIPCYVLSFYGLLVFCVRVPNMLALAQRFRRENRCYQRYSSDVRLRLKVSLFAACLYNGVYAVFHLVLGIHHHSAWYYAMAGYYALLAVLRLMLGHHARAFPLGEEKQTEWRKYRLCGVGLLLMNAALSVFILYFVRQLRLVQHHQITVIAMAVYTFVTLSVAISNVIRYRRYASPVCTAAKALALAAACVSLLSLENAMLVTFSKGEGLALPRIMLGATGAVLSLLMVGAAVYMMIHATKQMKMNAEKEKTTHE